MQSTNSRIMGLAASIGLAQAFAMGAAIAQQSEVLPRRRTGFTGREQSQSFSRAVHEQSARQYRLAAQAREQAQWNAGVEAKRREKLARKAAQRGQR